MQLDFNKAKEPPRQRLHRKIQEDEKCEFWTNTRCQHRAIMKDKYYTGKSFCSHHHEIVTDCQQIALLLERAFHGLILSVNIPSVKKT